MPQESIGNHATAHQDGSSRWKKIAAKYGIDAPLVLLMIKGTVAPTVGVAIYQVDSVARHFSTIGYLIPIMSILTVPVLPRARFCQNLVVTCLLTCFAAAISLLAMWCAVQARENTTHLNGETNSNGPVAGATITNTFRAYRPQYFLPSIIFSIFINVTATYGTQFATMKEAESLVTHLLESFFVGFGISAATNLLLVPFTSRNIVTMLMARELHGFKGALEAQSQYMASLPTRDWYGTAYAPNDHDSGIDDYYNSLARTSPWPEADVLKKILTSITTLQAKSQSELRYAKVEATWGRLDAKDLETISHLERKILFPLLGMECLSHATNRIEKRGGWEAVSGLKAAHSLTDTEYAHLQDRERQQWHWICGQLCARAQQLQKGMTIGLDESLYALRLGKRPASSVRTDLEANGHNCSPENRDWVAHCEGMIQQFLKERQGPIEDWCASKGMDDSFQQNHATQQDYPLHQRHLSQLYLVLDLDYFCIMTAQAILDLAKYAKSKVNDGTMARSRLIFPTWKQLKKWARDTVSREDSNLDYQEYSTRSGTVIVRLSDIEQSKKDPEHLPPVSAWEKISDKFRIISHIFGSSESAFGFRVATATMVISIVCFLRDSQQFFIEQRLIWGSIMVAISMTRTAGSGIYGQFIRFGGTALAMIASYVIWYIVDQRTAGIIVFLGITMFFYHYPLIKHPDTLVIPMIGMVTVILIVGYELQVKKIGIPISISNGQVYHPLYELAPYRLATVLGGLAVAFIFTHFPSVTTVRRQLREDLGASLYLLGNYYCSVHQTVSLKIRGAEGDPGDERSPGRRLQKARSRLFAKEIILLEGMKKHKKFATWELGLGGKFPEASYDRLINHTQHIVHFTTMISHVAESFQNFPTSTGVQKTSDSWLKDFKNLVISLELSSREVSATLSLIATAISTGRPLPSFLRAPEPVSLDQLLKKTDCDILSALHVCEPGYAAFAVIQVASALLADDLKGLLRETKKLVGEENFGIDVFSLHD
ncbi:uncharacterized protein N7446_013835 [Penicillium canescens]|uniref:uncharacterized protein n=1 Tax=Penicillium canescens TaxID=5083 RepID=UPI0026E09EB6|nr:uncharacterized protein N7446_013835 [Penicillium canescens]KAJ6025254.1 hypothetical protein N7444_012933 [Penicillium canescens]KAJ6042769.1 hypothetical protein N7446_013835 [Penicillium canescens]